MALRVPCKLMLEWAPGGGGAWPEVTDEHTLRLPHGKLQQPQER